MSKKIIYWILPLLFLCWSCQEDNVMIPENDVVNSTSELTVSEEILKLVNQYRQSLGLSQLARNKTADDLAMNHTNYMISKNAISHDNFNDRWQLLQQKENATSAGENVASGYPTAEKVFTAWLNSAGHKENIEGYYTHIGIAAIKDAQGRFYYTQLFYR